MSLVTKTCKMCGTEFDGYGKACFWNKLTLMTVSVLLICQ